MHAMPCTVVAVSKTPHDFLCVESKTAVRYVKRPKEFVWRTLFPHAHPVGSRLRQFENGRPAFRHCGRRSRRTGALECCFLLREDSRAGINYTGDSMP